jgi:hypothetical protein
VADGITLAITKEGDEDIMKLVLSRNGFDSENGGMASPILPDGRLVPLPIPISHDKFTVADINIPDVDVRQLVSDYPQRSTPD